MAILTTEGCIAEHFPKSKEATPPQTEGGTRRVSQNVATGIGEISVWVIGCFLRPTVTAFSAADGRVCLSFPVDLALLS